MSALTLYCLNSSVVMSVFFCFALRTLGQKQTNDVYDIGGVNENVGVSLPCCVNYVNAFFTCVLYT